MENNEQKERIRKNIKEEIAISNIRKEFDMKKSKNKKIIYAISSICAMFVLGIGIYVGTTKLGQNSFQNDTLEIGKTDVNKNKDESLNVELNINILKDMEMTSLDADINTIELEQLPEEFAFIEKLVIPEEYKYENGYMVYTRKNIEIEEYNVLHDYILNYRKDSINEIKIAFSKVEQPIRDYYLEEGDKISKIGDAELKISQSKETYIVTFEYNDIYFDIETVGITERQLLELLESIISNVTNVDEIIE